MSQAKIAVTYRPQDKQAMLLDACGLLDYLKGGDIRDPAAEIIGYGGAAYGGKTYGLLGLSAIAAYAFPGCNIAFFRRTYPELSGPGSAMQDAYDVFGGVASDADGGREWHFKETGSTFYFRHCQNEKDVYKYQSQQIDIMLIDEATHFTWFMIDYLLTRNRATVNSVKPFAVLTSNPGNIGHAWYSDLFDVMHKQGEHYKVKTVTNQNGKQVETFFIPAFIDDNPIGIGRDPGYKDRLRDRGEDIARALLKGDWSVFAGQAFRNFRYDHHTIEPVRIPDNWMRWRSTDYGFVHPFATYWWAKDPATGRLHVYREAVESGLTDREQAKMINDMTLPHEKISFTFASPDMWARKNMQGMVTTAADEYKNQGVVLTPADNNRVEGARKIRRLLADLPDGYPGVVIHRSCRELIKVLPQLVVSDRDPEDIEKVDGDDPYDGFRYGLTNIKTKTEEPKKARPNPMMVIPHL